MDVHVRSERLGWRRSVLRALGILDHRNSSGDQGLDALLQKLLRSKNPQDIPVVLGISLCLLRNTSEHRFARPRQPVRSGTRNSAVVLAVCIEPSLTGSGCGNPAGLESLLVARGRRAVLSDLAGNRLRRQHKDAREDLHCPRCRGICVSIVSPDNAVSPYAWIRLASRSHRHARDWRVVGRHRARRVTARGCRAMGTSRLSHCACCARHREPSRPSDVRILAADHRSRDGRPSHENLVGRTASRNPGGPGL